MYLDYEIGFSSFFLVYIYRFAYIFALFTLPTHTESKTAFEVEVFFACPGRQTAVRQSVRWFGRPSVRPVSVSLAG